MAQTRMALAAALLVASVAGAAALERDGDASVLLQSVVSAHGQSDAEAGRTEASSDLGDLFVMGVNSLSRRIQEAVGDEDLPWEKPLPPHPRQRITMARYGADSDSGAFVALQASKAGCDDCEFSWGDNVSFLSVVHMPGEGVQANDKFAFSFDFALDVKNENHFLSAMLAGQTISFQASCQYCGGSCSASFSQDGQFLDVTMPSLFSASQKTCSKKKQDLVLLDRTITLKDLDAATMGLTGQLNASLAMIRDGKTIASTTLSLDLQPVEPAADAAAASPAAGSQADEAAPSANLVGMGSGQAVSKSAEAEALPEMVNAILTDVVVNAMEDPNNRISIEADGCTSFGENGASTRCSFKLGSPDTVTMSAHLKGDINQGAYTLISIQPKVTGVIGKLIGSNLQNFAQEIEVPLCTAERDNNQFPLTVMGHTINLWLPDCGFYEMSMQSAPLELTLPRIVPLPLKEILGEAAAPLTNIGINDLNHLPPVSLDVRVQMLREGAIPMLDVKFKMGLGKA